MNLTTRQFALLKYVIKHDFLPLEWYDQRTLISLYKKGLISLRKGEFTITEKGERTYSDYYSCIPTRTNTKLPTKYFDSLGRGKK